MDRQSRNRWFEYSKAKDDMFSHADTKQCPWFIVDSDDKRRARLNRISHLLEQTPYKEVKLHSHQAAALRKEGYVRKPYENQSIVPDHYRDSKRGK